MAVLAPKVVHVLAIPVLSLAITWATCEPRTQRPAASGPVADTVGAVGSSIVTTVEAV